MIVIPMAGLSNRFKVAGYNKPKYMLEAKNQTLFSHSLRSFEKYFKSDTFLFITLNQPNIKKFIRDECFKLGIEHYQIVILKSPTRGQAETVYLGLKELVPSLDEEVFIFNIDTFRINFKKPSDFNLKEIDGYLETFIGSGPNWSNVLPEYEGSDRVKLTAEKQEISKYCCTGLYYWRSSIKFCETFEYFNRLGLSNMQAGEYYIAPMYNRLIEQGADIRFTVIETDNVIFCGTPQEYQAFINKD